MKQRIITALGILILGSFSVKAVTPTEELYERLDTSSLAAGENLKAALFKLVSKEDLITDLQNYILVRKDSPGVDLALDILLTKEESDKGALGLLNLIVKSSGRIQESANDLFIKNFQDQKYRSVTLQSQATGFRHKLTLKMLERAEQKPELAKATQEFLAKQLTPENAQLFILPLKVKDTGFNLGLSILVNSLSASNRFGELTDLLFDIRGDFRSAAFKVVFEELNKQPVLASLQKSNTVEKKRLVGRLLDFATQENSREMARMLAAVDTDRDIEVILRDYVRTKPGALTAADAIVQLRVQIAKDTQKEITKLMKDENPYVRKIAEEYLRQSSISITQTASN